MEESKLYGKQWASDYDETDGDVGDETTSTVDVLAELAAGGTVLELAAGTGRVAIPLANSGLKVTASDASEDMLAILKQKDVEHAVDTRVDVLPSVGAGDSFALICILLNSLWVMRSAEEQLEFMHNVARIVSPHGTFVVEMGVANPQKWIKPQTVSYRKAPAVRSTTWNPVTQQVTHTMRFEKDADTLFHERAVHLRVVTPNELLLMAKIAGLEVTALWQDWDRTEFSADSKRMIAVFKIVASA
jgi:ubiquinone/menaquinone biosynthesis C-methylase UbiE